jgi:cell division transport system permease protein
MHGVSYCLREAMAGLWRQRGSTALSTLTIAVAMLVLGAFLAVAGNVNHAVSTWSAAAEFTVYLRDDITQQQRVALNRELEASALVASRTFVSKADALVRFKADFPDLAGSAAVLEQNPMPASVEVRLKPDVAAGDEADALATHLAAAAGVADVRVDRRWLSRLAMVATAINWAGWILGGVLILAAALTVSTVVRLSLHNRRAEVEIMQLMGAPIGLLRGPLVVEGVLHGGLGAVVAVGLLYAAQGTLRVRLAAAMPGFMDATVLAFLPGQTALWLVVGGMLVGCAGGWMAARHVR